MSTHQEKQEIFDRYAKSKGIESWEVLTYSIPVEDLIIFTYEACNLVQEEQQKRISQNAKVKSERKYPNGSKYGVGSWVEYSVEKDSIINPENIIK
ncbi:hypothetical protein [Chryseobacterium indologenes]|uniref:hypothetical protein n=1 Tax=Chryseobacterium indologenes TaxID=253 RepID=UPI001BCFA69F|nr:hypothetical protein [Chryseobacterium indologenes]